VCPLKATEKFVY
jgi:hypothetical protein